MDEDDFEKELQETYNKKVKKYFGEDKESDYRAKKLLEIHKDKLQKEQEIYNKEQFSDNREEELIKLINNLKIYYPKVSLVPSKEFENWFNMIAPNFIRKHIIRTKQLKQCGQISNDFGKFACINGFACFVTEQPGHFLNELITSDNCYSIDFSHLQFICNFGELRNIRREEFENKSEDVRKFIDIFNALEKDPMLGVKVIKKNKYNFSYGLEVPKSWRYDEREEKYYGDLLKLYTNEIMMLFKQAKKIIYKYNKR